MTEMRRSIVAILPVSGDVRYDAVLIETSFLRRLGFDIPVTVCGCGVILWGNDGIAAGISNTCVIGKAPRELISLLREDATRLGLHPRIVATDAKPMLAPGLLGGRCFL